MQLHEAAVLEVMAMIYRPGTKIQPSQKPFTVRMQSLRSVNIPSYMLSAHINILAVSELMQV